MHTRKILILNQIWPNSKTTKMMSIPKRKRMVAQHMTKMTFLTQYHVMFPIDKVVLITDCVGKKKGL